MIVIGDSHVRAYGANDGYAPLFLGPGKENNFLSWECVDSMLKKCRLVEERVKPDRVVVCLGEPDTRFALGLGWHPWLYDKQRDSGNYQLINYCATRFHGFVSELEDQHGWKVYVQNIVPTQCSIQTAYIQFYNEKLEEYFGERFIDFSNALLNDDGVISREWLGDQIHANKRITEFVDRYFSSIGESIASAGDKRLAAFFAFNKQFRVFTIQDKGLFNRFFSS